MNSFRTKAIILRRTNYAEADRIIQCITPENGKISVMARGVRREKSKLAGGIELFARCDISVTRGKGELGILTAARLEQFHSHIIGDFDRLNFGYEAIKQISKAADALDEPNFYELLDQTFAALDNLEIDVRITRVWFWLQLAILLGVGANLSSDQNGEKLDGNLRYSFDQAQEVFVENAKGNFGVEHIKLLRLLSAQSPQVAARVSGIETYIDECLWVAERIIAH